MNNKKINTKPIFLVLAVFLIVLAAIWLKLQHKNVLAIATAQQFVNYLQSQQLEKAYTLVAKPSLSGTNLQHFKTIVERQLGNYSCKLDTQTSVFPFQSNGNRMRRFITDRPVEMSELTVDFAGTCLFSVTLHNHNNQWRVFKFQSHAG